MDIKIVWAFYYLFPNPRKWKKNQGSRGFRMENSKFELTFLIILVRICAGTLSSKKSFSCRGSGLGLGDGGLSSGLSSAKTGIISGNSSSGSLFIINCFVFGKFIWKMEILWEKKRIERNWVKMDEKELNKSEKRRRCGWSQLMAVDWLEAVT